MHGSAKQAVQAKLRSAPQLDLVNDAAKATWTSIRAQAKDVYTQRIVSYAEEWARLMQLEMSQGKALTDVAPATEREADYDGITGFMYGEAVRLLTRFWRHGKELSLWHNLKYLSPEAAQRATEAGGTVNPALVTIGPVRASDEDE